MILPFIPKYLLLNTWKLYIAIYIPVLTCSLISVYVSVFGYWVVISHCTIGKPLLEMGIKQISGGWKPLARLKYIEDLVQIHLTS